MMHGNAFSGNTIPMIISAIRKDAVDNKSYVLIFIKGEEYNVFTEYIFSSRFLN